jgi:transcriptional regulator with XRE-family HTH domain
MYDLAMAKQDTEQKLNIIAKRLGDALALRSITPAQLARDSDVDKATISLILDSKRPNTPAIIVGKLARALMVSVDYLVGISEDPEPKSLGLGEAIIDLARTAKTLPISRQLDLLAIAKAYEKESDEEKLRRFQAVRYEMIEAVVASGNPEAIAELEEFISERLASLSADEQPVRPENKE